MKASIQTLENIGAGSRVRTRDPLITNQVLYQLSYASDCASSTGCLSLICGADASAWRAM